MKRFKCLVKRWQFWVSLPVIIVWVIIVCAAAVILGIPSIVIGFLSDVLDKIVEIAPDYTAPDWLEKIVRWGSGTQK